MRVTGTSIFVAAAGDRGRARLQGSQRPGGAGKPVRAGGAEVLGRLPPAGGLRAQARRPRSSWWPGLPLVVAGRARCSPLGSRPGRACGRTRNGSLTCAGRACWNRCWRTGRSPPRRRGACAQAGAGAERRGNALCLVTGALFPVLGYDSGPRPGLRHARPAGQARHPGADAARPTRRPGPGPARPRPGPCSRLDAARGDIPAGPDGTAFGLEVTQIDGTTLELFGDPLLAEEFGVPAPGAKPLLRLVGLLHSGTRRWKAAVIGGYLDGENALADGLQDAFGPGQLNLADRGFFSMDRWIRFSGAGAHLLWRVKNGAKSVPFRTLQDAERRLGAGPAARERQHARPPPPGRRRPRPPVPAGHRRAARLLHRADPHPQRPGEDHRRSGCSPRCWTRTCVPAAELAVLYQRRWLIEIAFLHLKKTVRGTGRALRGRSAALARQEAWALLLAHNMIAGLAARAAATAGLAPGISFTAVLSLARAAVPADACCPHCGKRPTSGNAPLAGLDAAIARPPARPSRPEADLRKNRRRTTETDLRTSRLHPHHRPVKSPESRRKSRNLRAAPPHLCADG